MLIYNNVRRRAGSDVRPFLYNCLGKDRVSCPTRAIRLGSRCTGIIDAVYKALQR